MDEQKYVTTLCVTVAAVLIASVFRIASCEEAVAEKRATQGEFYKKIADQCSESYRGLYQRATWQVDPANLNNLLEAEQEKVCR